METASEFTCNFPNCGKTFISKSIRDRHLRVHTGERPYACPTCQQKFTQYGNMVVHMKSHETTNLRWDRKTSDKPFKCHFPSCHKSFTAKCSLQNHMQSDHNIKSSVVPSRETEPSCAQAATVSEDVLSATSSSAEKIYSSPLKNDIFSTVSSSSTINMTTSGCCRNQTLPDKPSEETVELSSMTKKGKLTHCQCLSCGCNDMFSKQVELKKHLFTYSPGLLGEHKFLLKVILEFSDIIIDWENAPKTNLEKELLVAYAGAVKQSVQKLIEQFPNTIEKEEKASQSLDIPPPANVDGQDPKNLDQLASLNDFVKYMSLACPPAHSANTSFLCATADENILVQSLHEDFDMFDFDAEGDDAAFDS